MTAPIAPGESSIAPSTDSSASRFCGGTCGDWAPGWAPTGAQRRRGRRPGPWHPVKPQRRTASTLGIHRRLWEVEAANCRQKERPFASFSTAGVDKLPPVHNSRVRLEREVHSALHRPVERAVENYGRSAPARAPARRPRAPRPRARPARLAPRPPRAPGSRRTARRPQPPPASACPRALGLGRVLDLERRLELGRRFGAVRLRLGLDGRLRLGLGGLHRGELLLGRQLAALGDDERLHLDADVLEDLHRDRVAADPLDRVGVDLPAVDADLVRLARSRRRCRSSSRSRRARRSGRT